MRRFRFRLSVIILTLFVLGVSVAKADVYQVYLYYDNGQLLFDRTHDQKVELFRGEQIGNSYSSGDFKAEVLDKYGKALYSTNFDPRPIVYEDYSRSKANQGGAKMLDKGQTGFRLPYFVMGAKLKIYDSKGVMILEYDISGLASTEADQVNQANAQNTGIAWYWWALALFILLVVAISIGTLLRRKYKLHKRNNLQA